MDGLPPIVAVPDKARLGLTPDQVELLMLACDGRHVCVTGPGGSGKTLVLERYAELRRATATVLCVSADQHSPLASVATLFSPLEVGNLVNEAARSRDGGAGCCLIIDEHSCLSDDLVAAIDAFDQVIIAGDPTQGTYDDRSRAVDALGSALGAASAGSTTVWRSHNEDAFNLLNALAYQGRYEAITGASNEAPDALRTLAGCPGVAASSMDLGLRAARHAVANPDSSVAIIVCSREEMTLVMSVLAFLPLATEVAPRIRFLHPCMLQGTEADLVLASTESLSRHLSRKEIEALSFVLLGRARFRIELRRPREGTADCPADLWLSGLMGWRYDTVREGLAGRPYEAFARSLPSDQVVREGLTYLTVSDRKTGRSVEFVNLMTGNVREDRARSLAAGSKRWKVTTRHIEELNHPLFKGS